jgi:hypothetical protein
MMSHRARREIIAVGVRPATGITSRNRIKVRCFELAPRKVPAASSSRFTVTRHRLVHAVVAGVGYFRRAAATARELHTVSSYMSEIRFRDRAGWQWEVVESPKRRVSEGMADRQRALYFLNRYETRRIGEFPADWAKRPSKELIQLCEVAEPL